VTGAKLIENGAQISLVQCWIEWDNGVGRR